MRGEADHRSFERETLQWLPDVARFALSLTREEADADDLVQDTYLSAQLNWHQFVPGSSSRAWMFTICRHRYYRLHERDAREVTVDDPELEALAAATLHTSAMKSGLSEAFERSEIRNAVHAALAELPPPFRDAAILVDVNDATYESAAQMLGVPIGTVRSRLFRARRMLQERLLAHARDAGFAVPPTMTTESGGMTMEPMPDCVAVMRQLWDYLDGELTDDRMAVVRDHLARCGRCQPQAEFERAFLAAIAHARRDHRNPTSLRDRVRGALRRQGYSDR